MRARRAPSTSSAAAVISGLPGKAHLSRLAGRFCIMRNVGSSINGSSSDPALHQAALACVLGALGKL